MDTVLPKVFFLGETKIRFNQKNGLYDYLDYTDQKEFKTDIFHATEQNLSDGEILTSFYAKNCYSALTTKKNDNISKIRDIENNIKGTVKSQHGSVAEHAVLNFIITDCSRILTHELVRHRAGCAYSQTSGRYVRTDVLKLVHDPILDPIKDLVVEAGLYLEDWYKKAVDKIKINEISDFTTKKKITSALRRLLPNGQSNEIGFSCNFRALRHILEMRTSEHAEWEIRYAFNQFFDLIKDEYKTILFDANIEEIDGLNKITFENSKI